MQALTDLADLATLLPLALCVALWLWSGGWARGAWLFLAGMGAVLGFMTAAKLALLGCSLPGDALASPSGHTAAATYVYGAGAALALRLRGTAALAAGGGIGLLVGLSRVLVHAHTSFEAAAGGVIGLVVLAVFLRLSGAAPPALRPLRLLFCAVPLIGVLHGTRLRVEPRLREVSGWIGWCL